MGGRTQRALAPAGKRLDEQLALTYERVRGNGSMGVQALEFVASHFNIGHDAVHRVCRKYHQEEMQDPSFALTFPQFTRIMREALALPRNEGALAGASVCGTHPLGEEDADRACQAEEPLVFQASEYIPSSACVRRWKKRRWNCDDEKCVQELLMAVKRLQHAECASVMTAQPMEGGFGSVVHVMALQLQRAKKMRRSLQFTGSYLYSPCEDKNLQCLWCQASACPFAAISSCSSQGEDFDEVMHAEGSHASQFAWAPDNDFGLCFAGPNALFRYASTLVGVLSTPNAALRQRVIQLKRDMGLPDEYLGVHVRHGDSCTAFHAHQAEGVAKSRGYDDPSKVDIEIGAKNLEKRCAALPAFAHALAALSEALGVTSVFVATDNPEALPLLQQLLPGMHLWQNPNVDRHFMSHGVQGQMSSTKAELDLEIHKKLMRLGTAEREKHVEELSIDALIMADSQGFVGQFRSHLSRFFYELASHEQGRVVPYVSADGAAWCWGQSLALSPATGAGQMEELTRCW